MWFHGLSLREHLQPYVTWINSLRSKAALLLPSLAVACNVDIPWSAKSTILELHPVGTYRELQDKTITNYGAIGCHRSLTLL